MYTIGATYKSVTIDGFNTEILGDLIGLTVIVFGKKKYVSRSIARHITKVLNADIEKGIKVIT